ncbi:hypothetical protein R3P38DRAFT_173419 [Favolaschia claudopus]|uniref:MYND-type domain-containing protein n=1 Tax=Favolaschia claudopus TaxID=2862362 RepID=A0AAW0D103_9AGAR
MDPDGPGRKTVFKINTGKLLYSQNAPQVCIYCKKKPGAGEKAASLCSGCQSVRFCNREHQKAFWPQHKDFCRTQQKNRLQQEASEQFFISRGIPPLVERQKRLRLLEDWIEIHRYTLAKARGWAFHTVYKPLDFRSQYFEFQVKYRPESDGNPSTSFHLNGAAVACIVEGTPSAEQFRVKLRELETLDAATRAEGTAGYLGMFICVYTIDGYLPWVTTSDIFENEIPSQPPPANRPWYWFPQDCIRHGVAYRVGTHSNMWNPGLMAKENNKWVWREHTPEELTAETGIML